MLKNLTITLKEGNITDRDLLDSLNVPSYNEIIVLGYHGIDIQEADAKTLITLLHLRNMSEQCNKHFNIVSEMFDVRNREDVYKRQALKGFTIAGEDKVFHWADAVLQGTQVVLTCKDVQVPVCLLYTSRCV